MLGVLAYCAALSQEDAVLRRRRRGARGRGSRRRVYACTTSYATKKGAWRGFGALAIWDGRKFGGGGGWRMDLGYTSYEMAKEEGFLCARGGRGGGAVRPISRLFRCGSGSCGGWCELRGHFRWKCRHCAMHVATITKRRCGCMSVSKCSGMPSRPLLVWADLDSIG